MPSQPASKASCPPSPPAPLPEESEKSFPIYGSDITDILPPEQFLWQVQGAYPGFDALIRTLYTAQRKLRHVPESAWPEDVLIPSDFYMQGVVLPELQGLPPEGCEERTEPPQSCPRPECSGWEAPEEEECGESFKAAGFKVSAALRHAFAFAKESVDHFDEEEPEGQNFVLSPENYAEVVTSVQTRLAAASWEVFKDVVAYSAGDAERIRRTGPGLGDFLPDSFFKPFNSPCFWLSLAGQGIEMLGEPCLGCFVFRGRSAASAEASLSVGFVSKNSYFDYAIPLPRHATLGFILESAGDFLSTDGEKMPERQKKRLIDDLKSTWSKVFPLIAHVYGHLPAQALFARRQALGRRILGRGSPMNSPKIHVWRWSAAKKRFVHRLHPALLCGGLRRDFLQEFMENEERAPIEVAQDPSQQPILN
ncbi:hypothetical protein MUN46_005665 [Mesosutterella sp. AGMB02718]|uniref:Uncharacterized protein n=1 Tax=Mesosutterella faecium TaxID=2925194 RepID=A0ABT7IQ74_9BURK|nr:hypothetical protein [Mesosutterella sp. AGMB02718]MDL2059417.1 hypothetical protein [Mesosutterella sp. AGMB02718]